METKKLGFGLMRLPLNSNDPTDINMDELKKMVDTYLDAGFNYFDTSFVYHNGTSENAIKNALVLRHDRNKYILASKYPTFLNLPEDKVEETLTAQLNNCGVDYFDIYLLHNLNRSLYDGIIQETHLFDYMKKWKEEGKIKHIAFSFHDDAKTLDRILTEHPEVEFVQIVVNYYDYDEGFIQAKDCYDIITKHGCQVIVMEPVKGGLLASVSESVEKMMKENDPDLSPASYAIRFAASLDNAFVVLSGMSNMEQMEDNLSYMKDFKPLTNQEYEILKEAKKAYMKTWKYQSENFDAMDDNEYGVSLSSIIKAYNSLMIQPNPYFGAELNYYKSYKLAFDLSFETADYSKYNETVGFDVNTALKEALDFHKKNSF